MQYKLSILTFIISISLLNAQEVKENDFNKFLCSKLVGCIEKIPNLDYEMDRDIDNKYDKCVIEASVIKKVAVTEKDKMSLAEECGDEIYSIIISKQNIEKSYFLKEKFLKSINLKPIEEIITGTNSYENEFVDSIFVNPEKFNNEIIYLYQSLLPIDFDDVFKKFIKNNKRKNLTKKYNPNVDYIFIPDRNLHFIDDIFQDEHHFSYLKEFFFNFEINESSVIIVDNNIVNFLSIFYVGEKLKDSIIDEIVLEASKFNSVE